MNDRKSRKQRRRSKEAIRKVSCADCGAEEGLPCVNKNSGERISGTHKARKLLAFANGLVELSDDLKYFKSKE